METHETTQSRPIRPEPVDRSVMREITAGCEEVERELFRQFRKVNDEDAALLRSGVVTGDAALIMQCSHRVKGAARTMGARNLALVCERLETAARDGRLDAVREALTVFESELHGVNIFLDHLETLQIRTNNNAVSAAQFSGEEAHEHR